MARGLQPGTSRQGYRWRRRAWRLLDWQSMTSGTGRDRWPILLAALHLTHSLWFAHLYPQGVNDPDLLAYFVYFANWVGGVTALHDLSFFPVPKPLPVFLLGPLASARVVFVLSALLSAWLGIVVYQIGRLAFGRAAGVLWSIMLLFDVDRAVLTLHSSADLYVTVLLFAAIQATLTRRYTCSAAALLLSALVKPVTLPCALHLLAVEGADRRRAWASALIPLGAVPLTLASNLLLLGSPFGAARFFAGFDALSQGTLMPSGELLRFVVWIQLAKHAFAATAPLGFIGVAVWLARDRSRLAHPLLLVPMLFLGGYLALSVAVPFVPFFRFFWPVQVAFLGFVVFGMVEIARRLAAGRPLLRAGIAVALLFFLSDDLITRQLHYRQDFAEPFGRAMAFVEDAQPTILRERHSGESVLTPVVFLPYVLWALPDARATPTLVAAAEHTDADAAPDWILWVPRAFLDRESRERIGRLVASGAYVPRMTRDDAALLVRANRDAPLAYLK